MPASAQAHTFGHLYTLPVPFWLYAWGAAAALILSFMVAGWLLSAAPPAPAREGERAIPLDGFLAALRRWRVPQLLRFLGVAFLLLTIAAGLFGNRDPLRNLSMTAFWVVFLLGGTYATVLFGNFYAALNPWRALTDALERIAPGYGRGRFAYPVSLDAWPALALYLALIYVELGTRGTPFTLGAMLAAYTAINFAGVFVFGSSAWYRHGEVFSVFFRFVALISPVDWRESGGGTLRLRWPGAAALEQRPVYLASVLFVLAMLASTAYDALRETQWWSSLFWQDPLGIFTPLVGEMPIRGYVAALPWYRAWDTGWVLLAPFVYFGVYCVTVALARAFTRTTRPLRELLLDFAFTLLPIVVAYHAAHYFTLLIDQGPKLLSLVSDPFGRGWDLFGTTDRFRAAYLPELDRVWHGQVFVILAGHVASVVLAHRVALRLFATRTQALLSQLPMLILMLGFTIFGLWILCQPLTSTMIRE